MVHSLDAPLLAAACCRSAVGCTATSETNPIDAFLLTVCVPVQVIMNAKGDLIVRPGFLETALLRRPDGIFEHHLVCFPVIETNPTIKIHQNRLCLRFPVIDLTYICDHCKTSFSTCTAVRS